MPHPLLCADPALDHFAPLPHGQLMCFRTFGNPRDPALLLIAGLSLQLVSWPASWIEAFVQAGFYVIAPDNRDAGRSGRVATPPPSKLRMLWPGLLPQHHYSLQDMAQDMSGLLQHLGIAQAHVLGMSLGGMIAQTLAAQYPAQVLSLVSIFSTTGQRSVGWPTWAAMRALSNIPNAHSSEQAQAHYLSLMRTIGDPSVPGIEDVWRTYADTAWQRSAGQPTADGVHRQAAAILRSGDRRAQLRTITCPTLVVHGDQDPVVHLSGGRATAQAIPGAQLMVVPGMRHQLDDVHGPALCRAIVQHFQDAAPTAAHRPTHTSIRTAPSPALQVD